MPNAIPSVLSNASATFIVGRLQVAWQAEYSIRPPVVKQFVTSCQLLGLIRSIVAIITTIFHFFSILLRQYCKITLKKGFINIIFH